MTKTEIEMTIAKVIFSFTFKHILPQYVVDNQKYASCGRKVFIYSYIFIKSTLGWEHSVFNKDDLDTLM